ncbi:metal ABC transporter permease [Alsobacter sp. R-9]
MTAFLQIDFPALLGASLAALACGLVGNLLVLTRRAMFSDALSHVMLPGVLGAFLLTGSTAAPAVLAGGIAAALVAALLVHVLVRYGRVDPSAALGIVFTTLFAIGIVLMEWSGAARTSFDVHHILFGNLETLVWPTAEGLSSLVDPGRLADLPRGLGHMALALLAVAVLLAALRTRLALVAFDPVFAAASGLPVRWLDLALLVATALATVAAFEAVGAILALAMIVCPAATARLLTRRLETQVAVSLAVALGSVWLGYAVAVLAPPLAGFPIALNAAGTIGAAAGLLFIGAALWKARPPERRTA